ncbi:hypothetical protein L0U88_20480 [Flavihumibacter sp. RY-1]|jgi:hypothetical protein|uniref:TonB-like protein n=1 Tax=Flavihumibacter fluminis TaxID=2909236 RepID=A0ABS9BMW0_9BACT|nr:hypothetical protein [Flavihumibacter fluminis]MCF1717031.1 hypothetical protein [Flavihumibacter fluminis]
MKKFLISIVGLLLITSTSFAQTQLADTTTQVKSCAEPVNYSVEDMVLKAQVGQSLTKPEANPTFKGGLDELKKYFASHSLTDTRAKDIVFKVHIGFIINCNGQAGNFQIVSKGKGDLQELAQQVLTVVKDMPQNWQPASFDNKSVDCYQILSFTIVGGALDKVSYR